MAELREEDATVRQRVILASASPRRLELLQAAGWEVEARPADVDETQRPGEPPRDYVVRLAIVKARALGPQPLPVLGADTTVVVDGELLGKPRDAADASAMLARLGGRRHEVLTGVCLLAPDGRQLTGVEATQVWFAPLSDHDIAEYVASGEPLDKAGAYAIQGRAARFIPRIEGSYSNVVGLPVALVWDLWRSAARRLPSPPPPTNADQCYGKS